MVRVYTNADKQNRIISYAAPGFLLGSDAVLLTYGGEIGERFSLRDENGICLFKRSGDEMIERTAEEMDADYAQTVYQPTQEQRISALEAENRQLKEALDLLLSGVTEEGADGNG